MTSLPPLGTSVGEDGIPSGAVLNEPVFASGETFRGEGVAREDAVSREQFF